MGFNATRRYRDSRWSDIGLLIVAGVLVLGMVLWAVGILG